MLFSLILRRFFLKMWISIRLNVHKISKNKTLEKFTTVYHEAQASNICVFQVFFIICIQTQMNKYHSDNCFAILKSILCLLRIEITFEMNHINLFSLFSQQNEWFPRTKGLLIELYSFWWDDIFSWGFIRWQKSHFLQQQVPNPSSQSATFHNATIQLVCDRLFFH